MNLPGLYFTAILFSLGGLVTLDLRFSLALRQQTRRTLLTLGVGVLVFLAWDLLGIGAGVFFEGDSGLLLGINLLPNLPLEEIFFLLLMNYTILLGYLGLERWQERRRAALAGEQVKQ